MNETNPTDELFFDIEAAGFGMHQVFFRKLIQRIAELPGVKARFGFQGGNRRPFFAAFDHSINLIEHRLTSGRCRFFANSGFTNRFLALGGRRLLCGLKFVYLFGNSIHLL